MTDSADHLLPPVIKEAVCFSEGQRVSASTDKIGNAETINAAAVEIINYKNFFHLLNRVG